MKLACYHFDDFVLMVFALFFSPSSLTKQVCYRIDIFVLIVFVLFCLPGSSVKQFCYRMVNVPQQVFAHERFG